MSSIPSLHPRTELLAAYREGKLAQDESAPIKEHLSACAECRAVAGPGSSGTIIIAPEELPSENGSKEPSPKSSGTQRPPGSPSPEVVDSPIPGLPIGLTNHPRYRIVKLLGHGGMGDVYKAEHKMMERTVALKVINPSILEKPTAVERFAKEVRAAARLAHPHIVAAFDADQVGDVHFLVMEYVEGVSLAQLVEKKGPLPVAHACDYIRQAASGLQHAHEQGMVHRDIKPQNLMLTPKGKIKILDFGLARFLSESHPGLELTRLGTVVGTPDFIAPEQVLPTGKIDVRADIYSLGCTFYFLLTGRPPFHEGTPVQRMMAHAHEEPTPIIELRSDLQPNIVEAIEKMMAKNPDHRYQKPDKLVRAMVRIIKGPGASQTKPLVIPPPRPQADLVGQTIAHYKLQKLLGADPTGSAYLAKDQHTGQMVVFKMLRMEVSGSDDQKKRFIEAMRTILSLRHPNLVTIYSAGKTGNQCWIVREFVEGEALSTIQRRLGPVPSADWREGFKLAIQLARALEHVHERDMVHGNVSPQNIIIRTSDKAAKLSNLMLNRAVSLSLEKPVMGEMLGDLHFMAPEQTTGNAEGTRASDIFSLSATVYRHLTGRPPFQGANGAEIITKVREANPDKPRKFQPEIPESFEAIILRMLSKDLARRPTAHSLIAELERIARAEAIGV